MKKAWSYIAAVLGAALAALGAGLLWGHPAAAIPVGLPYVCIGVGCGLLGYGLGEILGRRALKKHPELEKQQAIEAKDERNIALSNAAKGKSYNVMTYVFGGLLLVYALNGERLAVVGPLIAAYISVQIVYMYYLVKLNREF